MTKVYSLKSSKTYTAPSCFIHPRNNFDVAALWQLDEKNKLTNIDGLYISLSDHKQIYPKLGFNNKPLFNSNEMTLRDKIFLLDPSLDKLLSGTEDEKQRMYATGRFDRRIEKNLKEIKLSDLTQPAKSLRIMNDVYPLLRVKPLIEIQTESNVDMIISPCINISSKTKLTERFAVARQMLLDTRTLLETSSLKKYKEIKDLMNVLTLSKSIITDERNFHPLFDLLLCNYPDHVGLKIDRIQESETREYLSLIKFFGEFYDYAKRKTGNKPPPMHFINVDELGYVSYCNAISNIVCPIGHPSFSYMGKKGGGVSTVPVDRDTSRKYYHPISMDYPKFDAQNPFPCACSTCKSRQNANNVPSKEKPMHNRKHWLEVKDGEIQEFRETPVMLNIALRDKFARSNRTQMIAYIPNSPIFVHNS